MEKSAPYCGGLVGGELRRPLAVMKKRIKLHCFFVLRFTWLQISVGMKNFSMAMLCMAGKSLIACSLQPSQPSKRDRGEKKIKAIVKVTLAEVLLEVDNILCDHDGILDVGLNPLQALDALVTGVPAMKLEYKT